MSLRRKSRYRGRQTLTGNYRTVRRSNGAIVSSETSTRDTWERQITDTEGHPGWNNPYQGRDTGGEFLSVRQWLDWDSSVGDFSTSAVKQEGSFDYVYNGPLFACPVDPFTPSNDSRFPGPKTTWGTLSDGNSRFPTRSPSSSSKLDSLGTTAISRVKPTNSQADLAVTLAETLREGLPSLIGLQTWKDRGEHMVKNSGSEYLNVLFGWQPLISDIKASASSIRNWENQISQYERDAGRLVRRRFEFPVETESNTYDLGTPAGYLRTINGHVLSTRFHSAKANLFLTTEVKRKRWFSGAFVYALPRDWNSRHDMRRLSARAGEILGLEITPETLWNLAPWSWMSDWFLNTGDVISNLSAIGSDGLVMPYGYVMERTSTKYTYSVPHVAFQYGSGSPPISVFREEIKVRRKATPFGFGLSFDGFSPKQLSILAALGITRS